MYPYGTSLFIVSCSVIWLFLYFYLPETKGRYVEDITLVGVVSGWGQRLATVLYDALNTGSEITVKY